MPGSLEPPARRDKPSAAAQVDFLERRALTPRLAGAFLLDFFLLDFFVLGARWLGAILLAVGVLTGVLADATLALLRARGALARA